MAALYLHNSLWVPDATDSPRGPSPHNRSFSSATLQTDHSYPTQPLLHSSTSESVAYLDLLSRQPTHPNVPRGSTMGLSFEGDPTTVRERKGYLEKLVRRRLRRLKILMAVLEAIIALWTLYTTVRYFLAYVVYPSATDGQIVAIVLATVSLTAFAVLVAAAVIPFLQIYLLAQHQHLSTDALRTVLRFLASALVLAPALVNFALVFAWRMSSDAALNMASRCGVDVDVVWSIRKHATCANPSWGAWLALAIVRLLVTIAILAIYHLALASYSHTRRPSRHGSSSKSASESTYLGSPPMSATALPSTPSPAHAHAHQPSTSTLGSGSNSNSTARPTLRSSRSSTRTSPASASAPNAALPASPRSSASSAGSSDEDAQPFDPYRDAGLPSPAPPPFPFPLPLGAGQTEAERELYSFVDRFRSLVAQAAAADPPLGAAHAHAPPSAYAYAYSGQGQGQGGQGGYPPDSHVRILNSYVRRMPTIESLGSREAGSATGSATPTVAGSASVAGSSVYQGVGGGGGSRPPTRAGTGTGTGTASDGGWSASASPSEPPSRRGGPFAALSLAMEGLPALLGDLNVNGGVRRSGSVGSSSMSIVSAGTAASTSARLPAFDADFGGGGAGEGGVAGFCELGVGGGGVGVGFRDGFGDGEWVGEAAGEPELGTGVEAPAAAAYLTTAGGLYLI
ncbi:hypothetical protein C8R46DRAFT_1194458 [Mycena filopes]|nr:hypothetical protein C8R46DRAFT_1194458 [Mycena filopes]